MKKILTMSIVIVSLLSACSGTEEAALVESQVLVDEQVETDASATVIAEEPENKEPKKIP